VIARCIVAALVLAARGASWSLVGAAKAAIADPSGKVSIDTFV